MSPAAFTSLSLKATVKLRLENWRLFDNRHEKVTLRSCLGLCRVTVVWSAVEYSDDADGCSAGRDGECICCGIGRHQRSLQQSCRTRIAEGFGVKRHDATRIRGN